MAGQSLRLAALALAVGALTAGCDSGAPAGATPAPLDLEAPAAPTPWQRYGKWNQDDWSRFNTLAAPNRSPAPSVGAPPESGASGDPATGDPLRGKELAFARRVGGGCVACHVMGPETPELPGNVGPDLSLTGERGLENETLFQIIYDARAFNPETLMPPWGAHGMFSAAEIRDMVAFLQTLNTPATFANPLDDPRVRPVPEETRDAKDPFVNPAAGRIEAGQALWAAPGPNGKACASCHAEPVKAFKVFAATMPRWEPRLNKVLGVEEFVARHGRAATGASFLMQSEANTDLSIYLRSLAWGQPVKVATDAATQAAAALGQKLTETKIGQMNLACVDCHTATRGANKWIRGQWLAEQRGQFPHFPVWRTSRDETWDINKRIQWCNVSVRANDLPPDAAEHGLIELYLAKVSEGLAMDAPGIRH